MLTIDFGQIRNILCLGAHCDDIEIGCGGTILKLRERCPQARWHWVVFNSNAQRGAEAEASARAFLDGAASVEIRRLGFRDGFFPYFGGEVKDQFEKLKAEISPDIIFTHYGQDLHQDHRLLSELTWNTFRNHCILEYEIPKYDGGLGSPNFFVPLGPEHTKRKIELLMKFFSSQASKAWFTPDLFQSLMRIRGSECNAPDQHAEAFYTRKLRLI